MALQQTDNVSDVNINEDTSKNNAANIQNGTDVARHAGSIHHQSQQAQQQIHNTRPIHQQHPQQNSSNINEKFSTTKSPPIQTGGMMSLGGSPNNGGDTHSHGYTAETSAGAHYGQTQPPNQHIVGDNLSQKDDPYGQQAVTMGSHPPYGRYHPNDPNNSSESYRYGHSSMQPGKPPGIMTPNRPPQRYVPGQQIQGPTPTLNSLLQSHPPPPQQRYPNNYDSQQQTGPQQPQSYGSQGWSVPPRPYSPQMGQSYRTPSPANTPRNQPGYPMPPGQVGPYTSSPQQTIGTHSTGPTPTTSQYSPYPQRYSTPPGSVTGSNHRAQYSQQYPDVNRSWAGPGSSSPAVSPGPGVHPNAPASPHQMQHAGPPPNSPGHVPCGSPQPPQASPSPHQEMVGQNSNDSSSGGGICNAGAVPPGTAQQTMRPTPSPTGSSGSRSMSPAVAQQNISMPVRILNNQLTPTSVGMLSSHISNVGNMSMQQQHSNIIQAQNHQQSAQLTSEPVLGQLAARSSNINTSQVSQQSVQVSSNITTQSAYQPQLSPQSNIHNYKMSSGQGQTNPQNISPYTTPPPPPPSSQQYQQGNYAPRPQYPSGYGSNPNTGQLPPANTMSPASNQYVGRSMPNQGPGAHPQFPPYQQGWSTASPPTASGLMPNHGQGKNTPLPPSQTTMGSPRPLNYLKQHLQHKGGFVGAPSPTPLQNYGNGSSMHPPMGPPHHMGPPHGPSSMGPPSSAPQNTPSPQPPALNNPPPGCSNTLDTNTMVDHNNVSQDNSGSSSSTMSSHPVTSVVTTGPDGAPLDEASQQSTLSNASAASGEDPQCVTPKSRKNDPYNHGHLAPPNASPGQTHGNEDFEMHSPSNWPRAAASPVFNHVPQESYRPSTKKSDSLCKLYDMDENPDRRGWLDKLLTFMDERRTPISACPTISKQPLDLYRLYIYVKERGGFVEVCKVTKSKTWKDIAGLLGIGASSSAAYTLRKHYTKNLLAFECHFDRGGVDPLPIIQQVEAGSKKKTTKAASVPSPAGSSNSQDSFPSSVSANVSMDGYPGYTTGTYTASAQVDFNTAPQIQRPPSQNNAQSSHPGVPYQGQPNFNQYGPDQYNPTGPPGQYSQNQNQFPPPNRTMFTPYGPENDTGGNSSNNFPPYGPARPFNQPPGGNSQPASAVATSTSSSTPSTYPPQPPSQQDYYRQQEQNSQPRRHPDFVKESQSYPGYAQRPQIYPGWQNNPAAQYRNQYPSQQAQQQWNSPRPSIPAQPQPNQQQPQPGNQWDQHRYPPQAQQPYQPNTPPPSQWNTLGNAGQSPNSNSPLRPTHRGPSGNGKQPPFNMPPPPQVGGNKAFAQQPVQQTPAGFITGGQIQKRDIIFPPDSIEATTPILYRRKRLAKSDVCPIDPWRIFMSLRSGLLSESTWALDILNVLLFDDSAVQYFGLTHLPGLLNLLLEHFQKSLLEMFVNKNNTENPIEFNCQGILDNDKINEDIDLGQIVSIPNSDERVLILSTTQNYTMVTRKGIPVRIQNAEDDIFVSETLKKWDYESNKNYQLGTPNCSDPWTYGHNDRFPHNGIIDVFKSEIVDIPFARYLKPKMNNLHTNHDEQQQFDNNSRETSTKTDDLRSVINKRPYIVPTNSEDSKKMKNNDEDWNENSLAIKTDINCNTSKVKQQLIDSDCRQVDMEIEPRNMSSLCVGGNRLKPTTILSDNKHASEEQTIEENRKTIFDPKITVKDPATILRRRRMSEYEDECYTRDEASLYLVNDSQDILARRCICLSNIFRNLTFVPGNEVILARSSTFLALLGNLLLLNHDHVLRTHKNRNYDREEDTDFGDSCSSLQGEKEWWWEYLIQIRENMLVAVANIAGHLELSKYEEIITRPVLDGLLHWAVCPSAHGQDPFPSCGPITVLSPQRLALEALCKLCVTDANVDLVIATPPFSRLEKLCSVLTRHLCRNEDQVLREFSVNLLHYLAAADSAMSRTVALQSPCISYLVAFIEQAEQTALGVANQHGINYLRENPDSMGTSLDMLRRAAGTLLHLSKHPDNRPLFMQQEQRLLGLVMSHILDQQVALIISRVLFQVSRGCGPMTSIEYKSQLKQKKSSSSAERIITSLQTLNVIRNIDNKSINVQNDQQALDVPSTTLIGNDDTSISTDLPVIKSDNEIQESIKIRSDSNKTDISTTAPINIDKLINSETSSNASSNSNSSTSNNNDNTNKNLSTSITNPTAAVA